MEPMATIALRAAREAALHISRAFDRPDLIKISDKGRNDWVTNIDKDAERIVTDVLHHTYPDHSIYGEEGITDLRNPEAEYEWIIDPIDGTTNFTRQIPHFCVSIACTRRGKLEHGVIVDPIRNEEFVASRGKGCRLNGHAVRSSKVDGLDGAVIATGGVYSTDAYKSAQASMTEQFMHAEVTPRQPGSACLELAYVAAGRLDGMYMRNLNAWDMAAGALMVIESGGLVGDFKGGLNYMESGDIVAASPRVFKHLAPMIKRTFASAMKADTQVD